MTPYIKKKTALTAISSFAFTLLRLTAVALADILEPYSSSFPPAVQHNNVEHHNYIVDQKCLTMLKISFTDKDLLKPRDLFPFPTF